jgi:hypothetical protein
VPDFEDEEDLTGWAEQQLRLHGLSDTEDVVDPEFGRKIPGVATGHRFFMKLHHTAESKGQGRGAGRTRPTTPRPRASKRVSMLDVNALLSHGATETLRDAGAVRGQKNENWWLQFMQGNTPADPKVPMVYEKFVNQLKAAGINVVRDGHQTHVMALTTRTWTPWPGTARSGNGRHRPLRHDLKPVKGGLFDEQLTGGHGGKRWAAIKLPEPMPNPVMEEPIRRILGLTGSSSRASSPGEHELGRVRHRAEGDRQGPGQHRPRPRDRPGPRPVQGGQGGGPGRGRPQAGAT